MTLDKESAKRPSNAFLAGPFSPTSMLGPRTSAQPAKPWAPLEELADTMPNTSILAGTILSERLDSFY